MASWESLELIRTQNKQIWVWIWLDSRLPDQNPYLISSFSSPFSTWGEKDVIWWADRRAFNSDIGSIKRAFPAYHTFCLLLPISISFSPPCLPSLHLFSIHCPAVHSCVNYSKLQKQLLLWSNYLPAPPPVGGKDWQKQENPSKYSWKLSQISITQSSSSKHNTRVVHCVLCHSIFPNKLFDSFRFVEC